MSLEPGQTLSHYRLLKKIGQGGMGVVYEAVDTRLQRHVAVKILPAHLTADPERIARFEQEARLAAAFSHPHIATVHDVGRQDDVSFIVMELVQGDSLRHLVGEGPVPAQRALEIAVGVASGLARAHRDGVVHRDLKPDNVVLTDEGVPKILDFGLGKLLQEARLPDSPVATQAPTASWPSSPPAGDLASPGVTRAGQIVGTLAYMSPEQLQSRPVDARTDIFAFGVMLHEMLAGARPFSGSSTLETMTAILRDPPPPLDQVTPGLPPGLQALVERCLQKDPQARFDSGQELLGALERVRRAAFGAGATPLSPLRVTRWLAPVSVAAILLVAGAGWMWLRSQRTDWARSEAIPEIERLLAAGDRDAAWRLILEAEAVLPGDAQLRQLLMNATVGMSVLSDPPGATVSIRGYTALDRPWVRLGVTPLPETPMPFPARLRIEKDGLIPFEGGPFLTSELQVTLPDPNRAPEGMVWIPGGPITFGQAEPVAVPAFRIDRHEVTNRQYKEFVDDGGYRRPDLWPETFDDNGTTLSRQEAMARFVDAAGRPGPAGWVLGSFPSGTADHPVSGISWYEAAAFAAWSGTSLPTVFHWHQAAQQGIWGEILLLSNFSGQGAAPVGQYQGVGRFGTSDMAGNVSEWCLNARGSLRYVLGGAWSEPSYRYQDPAAASAMDRSAIFGFRRIKADDPLPPALTASVEEPVYDFRQEQPVGDEAFHIIRGMFAYDPSPLDAKLESLRDDHEHWREEIVSIRSAYGDERIPVHLFLPRSSRPPYQAVIYVPGSHVRQTPSSATMPLMFADFIPRAGRVLVFPVYKGTFERRIQVDGLNDYRDMLIQINKDLRRTIDYLETRDDIDSERLGYYGLSWGSTYGFMHTAIEGRFKASVLLAGGLYRAEPERPAEICPVNFAPRSTVPTLLINSRNDFDAPIETNIRPMLDFLGAPPEHKKLFMIDGGHVPQSPNDFIREALDWYDRYLGPVQGP